MTTLIQSKDADLLPNLDNLEVFILFLGDCSASLSRYPLNY